MRKYFWICIYFGSINQSAICKAAGLMYSDCMDYNKIEWNRALVCIHKSPQANSNVYMYIKHAHTHEQTHRRISKVVLYPVELDAATHAFGLRPALSIDDLFGKLHLFIISGLHARNDFVICVTYYTQQQISIALF